MTEFVQHLVNVLMSMVAPSVGNINNFENVKVTE